jgi:hypothetical protein
MQAGNDAAMRPGPGVRSRAAKWCYSVAAALGACFVTTAATAAPITGGTYRSSMLDSPAYEYFLTPEGALDGGLSAAGCPFLPPARDGASRTFPITVTLSGWYGPINDVETHPNQQVIVRGKVAGTVEDAAGNVYNAAGSFLDSSTHDLFDNDLLFDGRGMMTLAGQAGVVAGEAELRVVNAPLEFAFTFTKIRQCNIRPTK